jgi:hypothetical protein
MLIRALLSLKKFWTRALEIEVRYTSVPVWNPWRDYTITSSEDLQSSR